MCGSALLLHTSSSAPCPTALISELYALNIFLQLCNACCSRNQIEGMGGGGGGGGAGHAQRMPHKRGAGSAHG